MTLKPVPLALLIANGVLAACLIATVLEGEPALQWPLAEPAAAPPHSEAFAVAPLPVIAPSALAAAWQRPLFSPDRQPDLGKLSAAPAQLDGITLSGVVLDGDAQWALLRRPDHSAFKLKRGQLLDGDWVLDSLTATGVTFVRRGQGTSDGSGASASSDASSSSGSNASSSSSASQAANANASPGAAQTHLLELPVRRLPLQDAAPVIKLPHVTAP